MYVFLCVCDEYGVRAIYITMCKYFLAHVHVCEYSVRNKSPKSLQVVQAQSVSVCVCVCVCVCKYVCVMCVVHRRVHSCTCTLCVRNKNQCHCKWYKPSLCECVCVCCVRAQVCTFMHMYYL